MGKLNSITIAAAFFMLVLASCHTAKNATHIASHPSKNPKFIDHVTIGGKGSNNIQMHVIQGKHDYKGSDGTIVITKKERVELQEKYAEKVGIPDKKIQNLSLYTFINQWYGVPYQLGGTDKDGIDCSGFAQRLYAEVYGIDLVRTAYEQFEQCKSIRNSDKLREGYLVFFGTKKRITHVGVYLGNNHFVHASTSEGVTISSLDDPYWQSRYAGGGKIVGAEE